MIYPTDLGWDECHTANARLSHSCKGILPAGSSTDMCRGMTSKESRGPPAQWGQKAWVLFYVGLNPKVPWASVPHRSQQGDNFWGSALLQCLTFSLITHLSLLPTTGYGQSKGTCDGYCSYVCAKRDEWTFSQSCAKMYCCIPPPKKGKWLGESERRGRAALAVGLRAMYSWCNRDGVHCFEVKMGRYDFCVLCASFTSREGSSRRGSAPRPPWTVTTTHLWEPQTLLTAPDLWHKNNTLEEKRLWDFPVASQQGGGKGWERTDCLILCLPSPQVESQFSSRGCNSPQCSISPIQPLHWGPQSHCGGRDGRQAATAFSLHPSNPTPGAPIEHPHPSAATQVWWSRGCPGHPCTKQMTSQHSLWPDYSFGGHQ